MIPIINQLIQSTEKLAATALISFAISITVVGIACVLKGGGV